jgi:DNA-binding MarR family transcriptional regulator
MTGRSASRRTKPVDVLVAADQAVTAVVTPVVAAENISLEQWRVLLVLADEAGQAMREIAQRAGLSAPTATRMVDRLVTDGLAYRRSDPLDRRRVLVHISDQGKEILDRVGSTLNKMFGPVLRRTDAAVQENAIELLTQLADAARSSEHQPSGSARS